MKKVYFLVVSLLAVLSFGQSIPFTGTGALNVNGWTNHSGTAGQTLILETASDSGNSLTYSNITTPTGNRTQIVAGNTEDLNFPISAITDQGYFSALIKVLNTTGMTSSATGDYFMSFGAATGTSVTVLPGRIYIKKGSADDKYVLGVLNHSGGTVNPTYSSTELTTGATVMVVLKYDKATNTASLFVDPTLCSTEPSALVTNNTGTSAAPASLLSIVIRQAGSATAVPPTTTGNIEIDEIKVANNWTDVTTCTTAGISEISLQDKVKLYPSIVSDFATVELEGSFTAEVYNMNGQLLSTEKGTNTVQLSTSSLEKGTYFVRISQNGESTSQKFIKK